MQYINSHSILQEKYMKNTLIDSFLKALACPVNQAIQLPGYKSTFKRSDDGRLDVVLDFEEHSLSIEGLAELGRILLFHMDKFCSLTLLFTENEALDDSAIFDSIIPIMSEAKQKEIPFTMDLFGTSVTDSVLPPIIEDIIEGASQQCRFDLDFTGVDLNESMAWDLMAVLSDTEASVMITLTMFDLSAEVRSAFSEIENDYSPCIKITDTWKDEVMVNLNTGSPAAKRARIDSGAGSAAASDTAGSSNAHSPDDAGSAAAAASDATGSSNAHSSDAAGSAAAAASDAAGSSSAHSSDDAGSAAAFDATGSSNTHSPDDAGFPSFAAMIAQALTATAATMPPTLCAQNPSDNCDDLSGDQRVPGYRAK
jgi:hypothetical protein